MHRPLVSIIIPAYNTRLYMERCLNSVIGQSYQNLDIIVADDGSTDETGVILDDYARKDERIRIIHKKNEGAGPARNAGLKLAQGEWISFLDADDYILPEMIENMLQEALSSQSDLVICSMRQMWEAGQKKDVRIVQSAETIQVKNLGRKLQNDAIVFNSVNKLYKKDIIKGVFFPDYEICEDVVFNRNVFPKAGKVRLLPDIYYINVQRPGSTTRRVSADRFFVDTHFKVVRKMKQISFPQGDKITRKYWDMLPGKILFELTVSLLLLKKTTYIAYAAGKKGYFKTMRNLRFDSFWANGKKSILYVLLRLHLYDAAIRISVIHNGRTGLK